MHLDSLLLSIYGKSKARLLKHSSRKATLQRLDLRTLYEIEASLRKHIKIVGICLRDELIRRDRYRREQERICGYVDRALNILADNNYPPLRFSLAPPPAKSPHIVISPTNNKNNNYSSANGRLSTARIKPNKTVRISLNNNMQSKQRGSGDHQRTVIRSPNNGAEVSRDPSIVTSSDVQDDYIQWLHAMKLVARLPGGMPPEFRRKLWLTLAEKYLKSRNVDWKKEENKCFSEEWREDDEELGVQIVKDLHRTGSNLCSGPAAKVNQARLKRILLGYARYNPKVGYCQGFNMLGALILQVMDKEEVESMKVMIYLVEGILPEGYFCGSMGGLQADMGVFRELMQCKMPRLAKHLEKLQGPVENAFEPPLTNVFTMQWFLTMFCTCLPMTCVLRVWDLVLIEGSDVLLRTSLVLWGLLEERVLSTRSADDFYCKMGSFASELLNGHLIDSNSLIEKIVQLGPIMDIEKLRSKHLCNITPMQHKSNLPLYLGEEDPDNDDESRLAVATVWGIPWSRRGSQATSNMKQVPTVENKERLALDISLLKKQYEKLRERQKQAHIIITTACSTARQGTVTSGNPSVLPVNQLLAGRSAIVTHQGRRITTPVGVIPPARKPSLPTILQSKPAEKQLRRGETLHWRDTDLSKRRRDSLTWKEIKADRDNRSKDEPSSAGIQTKKLKSRVGKSDSSSYSEESDDDDDIGSSTDTSLCDDDASSTGEKTRSSSIENSPKRRLKSSRRIKGSESKQLTPNTLSVETHKERIRPKSWAPSTDEIPFMLLTSDSPIRNSDNVEKVSTTYTDDIQQENYLSKECDRKDSTKLKNSEWAMPNYAYSPIAGDLAITTLEPLDIQTDIIELPIITSTSQLSPMPDIASFINETPISPLPTPKPLLNSINSLGSCDGDETKKFDVNDDGVTNQYFERVNSVECPKNVELYFPLNEDDSLSQDYQIAAEEIKSPSIKETCLESKSFSNNNQRPDLLIDHLQNFLIEKRNESNNLQSSDSVESGNNQFPFDPISVLGERDDNIPGENLDDFCEIAYTEAAREKAEVVKSPPKSISYLSRASQKRRDPRRLTLTRLTPTEIEERVQALEKHASNEMPTQGNNRIPCDILTVEEQITYEQQTSPCEAYAEDTLSNLEMLKGLEISNKEIFNEPLKTETSFSTKTRIPSTTDLEERYERQMSASEKIDKDHIRLSNCSPQNKQNGSGSSKNESITRETRDNKLENQSEIITQKEEDLIDSKSSRESKSSPQRTPSTAELEKRFDALEVKTDVERTIPNKHQKEPPDIKTAIAKSEDSENTTEHVDHKSEEKCKQIPEIFEDKHEPAKKKTPPSTEELEKRFHALEKQMSTSTLASASHEHVESSPPRTTSQLEKSPVATSNDPRRQSEDKDKDELPKIKGRSDERKSDIEMEKVHFEETQKDSKSGRRASEPPSTEDLERRYESLKRRMSTRTLSEKSAHSETIDEALCRIEKIVLRENKNNEKPESIISPHLSSISESEPKKEPSVLKQKDAEKDKEGADVTKSLPDQGKQLLTTSDGLKTFEPTKDEEHKIPTAPPLPPRSKEERSFSNVVVSSERQALIEELQSKIYSISDEETFKPSSINPNRKTPTKQLEQSSLKKGEISEAHARTAFLRSGINEPWHGYRPKVVRRFSDLPSRADLENRLEFLEQKFYRKLYKQRCASDSEVASRKHLIDESPNPSSSPSASVRLEQRLQALEKQLSENSIKLLEAMHAKAQNNVGDSESPRRLSVDTIDGTGKELVRYTHVGELEEAGIFKPINISINIKMTLDKNMEARIEKGPNTASDLEQRLEALEQQLKESQKPKVSSHEKSLQNDSINEPQYQNNLKETQLEIEDNEANLSRNDVPNQKESSPFEAHKREYQKVEVKDREATHQNENEKEKFHDESASKSTKESNEINLHEPTSQKKTEELIEENSAKQGKETCMKNTETAEIQSRECKEGERHKCNETCICRSVPIEKESISASKKSESEKLNKAEKSGERETFENREEAAPHPACIEVMEDKDQKGEDIKVVQELTTQANKSIENPITEMIQKECETIETACVGSTSTESKNLNEEANNSGCETLPEKLIVNASEIGTVDANKKTLVLLLDNEPKAVKVRRLTRANTEELEGLFQALEKQLHERNLVKSEDGTLKHIDGKNEETVSMNDSKAISELTKEIEEFTHPEKGEITKPAEAKEEPYDWGSDPVKRHLKRKTVHLPSTKELEARFRSLERQIKLLEDVENIDVEQRLHEIERKIKLQYSLANEKDLTKYLELCEGKGLDDEPLSTPTSKTEEARCECGRRTPSKEKQPTPKASPSSKTERTSSRSPSRNSKTKCSPSPSQTAKKEKDRECKERSSIKRTNSEHNKQPIHPLEMLLDPSPDESKIPTTGELEHRIRILDGKHRSPTPPRKSRSRSPAADSSRKRTPEEEKIYTKQPLHTYKKYDIAPAKPEPPTAEELEARMRALEEDHIFDSNTQKNFKKFNEKLKSVISPSVSFEESKIDQVREISPRRCTDSYRSPPSRSTLQRSDAEIIKSRSTSPKVIRFSDEEDLPSSTRTYRDIDEQRRSVGSSHGVLNTIEENSKILHRILKKTLAEPKEGRTAIYDATITSYTSEGLDAMGSRLMRETSPLRRTGTHTGVPLRTDDNINERLSSIKDTIKSIDSLCEEKPYRKEKCQRYIDSLFSDSTYFAHKKSSLEELRSRSASRSRTRPVDYTPSIHVSDLSQRPSDYFLSRSTGSAESIRTSPLRAASPLHYRSNRELARTSDVSPSRRGRRYDEDREKYESRVRRDYILPNSFLDNHSNLRSSSSSLTKFYKVDSQLDSYERDKSRSHSPSRSPLKSSAYELRDTMTLHNNHNSYTANTQSKTFDFDKPTSPYRQTSHNLLTTDYTNRSKNPPVYNPSKLEIRHTTVTSTFYDRLLTEKQLEKSFSRTPSRSPIQETSTTTTASIATTFVAEKSYLDTTTKIGTNSFNFSSSLSPTIYTPQLPTLHQNTNTVTPTTSTTIRTTATLNGTIVLPTSTTTATATTYSMTPFSMNSTLSSYLNNTNQTSETTVMTTTTTSTLSEPTPLASTISRSYLNLSSSTSPSTTASAFIPTTTYSYFLPSISDKITTACPPSTTSTLNTIIPPLGSIPAISTFSSYTSASTTNATYPSMSLPFQSSSLGSNILGQYSSFAPKADSATTESISSTQK